MNFQLTIANLIITKTSKPYNFVFLYKRDNLPNDSIKTYKNSGVYFASIKELQRFSIGTMIRNSVICLNFENDSNTEFGLNYSKAKSTKIITQKCNNINCIVVTEYDNESFLHLLINNNINAILDIDINFNYLLDYLLDYKVDNFHLINFDSNLLYYSDKRENSLLSVAADIKSKLENEVENFAHSHKERMQTKSENSIEEKSDSDSDFYDITDDDDVESLILESDHLETSNKKDNHVKVRREAVKPKLVERSLDEYINDFLDKGINIKEIIVDVNLSNIKYLVDSMSPNQLASLRRTYDTLQDLVENQYKDLSLGNLYRAMHGNISINEVKIFIYCSNEKVSRLAFYLFVLSNSSIREKVGQYFESARYKREDYGIKVDGYYKNYYSSLVSYFLKTTKNSSVKLSDIVSFPEWNDEYESIVIGNEAQYKHFIENQLDENILAFAKSTNSLLRLYHKNINAGKYNVFDTRALSLFDKSSAWILLKYLVIIYSNYLRGIISENDIVIQSFSSKQVITSNSSINQPNSDLSLVFGFKPESQIVVEDKSPLEIFSKISGISNETSIDDIAKFVRENLFLYCHEYLRSLIFDELYKLCSGMQGIEEISRLHALAGTKIFSLQLKRLAALSPSINDNKRVLSSYITSAQRLFDSVRISNEDGQRKTMSNIIQNFKKDNLELVSDSVSHYLEEIKSKHNQEERPL